MPPQQPSKPSGAASAAPEQTMESFEYWAGNPAIEIADGHIYVATGSDACSLPNHEVPAQTIEDIELNLGAGGCADVATLSFTLPSITDVSNSCVTLATSVPCCMPVPEFLEFIGAFDETTHRLFRHCRVLYSRSPEEYLVAIWLVSPEAAVELIQRVDGKPFNPIEPGICRMHRVIGCAAKEASATPISSVTKAVRGSSSRPACSTLRAPLPHAAAAAVATAARAGLVPSPSRGPCRSPIMSPTLAPCFQPDPALLIPAEEELFYSYDLSYRRGSTAAAETDFCSICREDIEENPSCYQLTDLGGAVPLTILCGHTFHARCLSHWCDSNCPLCRFQQHPSHTSSCDVCGESDGIYICLVCSFIGCMDSEGNGHAQQHYQDSNHAYALEVSTQKVWDYAGNGYVHRLLFNHEDGKMVEHSGRPTSPSGGGGGTTLTFDMEGGWGDLGHLRWADLSDECMDDCGSDGSAGVLTAMARRAKKQELVVAEFNALLSSQMTTQQQFFENRQREQEHLFHAELVDRKAETNRKKEVADELQRRVDEVKSRNAALEAEIAAANSESEASRRQIKKLEELNRRISAEQAEFEKKAKEVSTSLAAKKKSRSKQVEELQQQIKDLELYVKMQKRLESTAGSADMQGAHMVVTEGDTRNNKNRRGRRR